MANTKVKTTVYSWEDIVNSADPMRGRNKPVYIFSNGRKFTDTAAGSSSPRGERMLFSGRQILIGGEIAYL